MSRLRAKISGGVLKEHYQRGALRLLPVPVLEEVKNSPTGGAEIGDSPASTGQPDARGGQFFGLLSTLGGGMVNGDNYEQEFEIENSRASICSQSNQKIFKGTSALKTTIRAKSSAFVYYNDANIFFENSDFTSATSVHIDEHSSMFYLDGGFCAYAKNNFCARLNTRILLGDKLLFNDAFCYSQQADLVQFFKHSCFYQIIIKGGIEAENIHTNELIAYSSKVKDLLIIRVLSSDNDIAMSYISQLRRAFVALNNMTYIQVNQF